MPKNTWAVGTWDDEQQAYASRREVTLPEGLRFTAIWTSLDGLVSDGLARTRLRPQGDATHTYVHLEEEGGQEYTIEVQPLLGRAQVAEGWTGPRS